MSVWRDRCRARIAELVKDLPDDATLQQRRKALWGKGWAAHQGTRWGRRMWGKEVRAYLGRHGDSTAQLTRHPGFQWPEDICFPFRDQPLAIGLDMARPASDFTVRATIVDGRVADFTVIRSGGAA